VTKYAAAAKGIGDQHKTTQVRALEKINTRITRTKRHYPARDGTTITMGYTSLVINKNAGELG
jgi:ribosomal protein L14